MDWCCCVNTSTSSFPIYVDLVDPFITPTNPTVCTYWHCSKWFLDDSSVTLDGMEQLEFAFRFACTPPNPRRSLFSHSWERSELYTIGVVAGFMACCLTFNGLACSWWAYHTHLHQLVVLFLSTWRQVYLVLSLLWMCNSCWINHFVPHHKIRPLEWQNNCLCAISAVTFTHFLASTKVSVLLSTSCLFFSYLWHQIGLSWNCTFCSPNVWC